jgi:hypothetical protein
MILSLIVLNILAKFRENPYARFPEKVFTDQQKGQNLFS